MSNKSNSWVIFCTGASITGRIEELKEHFKDWENSIAVNAAVNYFPSTYWLFLDNYPYFNGTLEARKRNIITSWQNYGGIHRKYPDFEPYDKISSLSNSGITAVKYAIEHGAKQIITCGLDLDLDWGYFDGTRFPRQNKNYVSLIRNEFRRLIKSKGKNSRIMSVNPNNTLELEYYDINKEFNL